LKLTASQVKSAKPAIKAYKLSDGRGLYLLVQPNGAKYWRLKYRFGRKEKLLAIGVYPDVSLAQARAACDEAKVLLRCRLMVRGFSTFSRWLQWAFASRSREQKSCVL
jgi:hypothetical protein